MRWNGMAVFAKSFQTQLTAALGYDADTAKQIAKTAKPKYREIIAKLPEFEKGDHFQMNIVNCAMLCAFILSMHARTLTLPCSASMPTKMANLQPTASITCRSR